MSGNNMESLLMGGDDSSSGESDDEVNVPMGTTTTAASAVSVAAAPVAPPPVAVPKPPSGSAQSAQMARLKNLYNISKSSSTAAAAPQGTAPSQPPRMHQQQQPPQRPPPQQQQQPPPRQQPRQSVPNPQQQQQQRAQLYKQSQQQQPPQQHPIQRSQPPQQQQQQRQPQPNQYSTQPASSQKQQHQQQRQQYSQTPQQRQPSQPVQHRQHPPQPVQQQHGQPIHRPPVGQSRTGTSSQQQQPTAADPFAPTPLSQIKQSHTDRRTTTTQQQQPIPQQHQRQPAASQPPASRAHPNNPATGSAATSLTQQEIKRQKEKFLMFTRVLIKYLEQKDKRMHTQAKLIIKDCAERNKRHEPGYESVTISMKRRLKELVGDHYWKKANDYLIHFIEQKRRQHAQNAAAGGSSSGSSSQQQQQQQQQMRQRQSQQAIQLQRQRQQAAAQRQAQTTKDSASSSSAKARSTVPAAAPTATDVSKGTKEKPSVKPTTATIKATKSKAKSSAAPKTTAADSKTTTTTKGKTTKKTVRRKSTDSVSSRKSTTAKVPSSTTTTIVKRIIVEEPPREYKEMMELIDHAVEYDWPSIGQLLGNKADLKLNDEERQLLYGDCPPDSMASKKKITTKTATTPATPEKEGDDDDDEKKETPSESGVRPGWGRTNVLSARAAWARIRLKELRQRKLEAANSAPVVADGLLTLPTAAPPVKEEQKPQQASTVPAPSGAIPNTESSSPDSSPSTPPKPAEPEGSWVNEEAAEQDKTLALLSEGCQIYLKGVLEKAIQCARQRQNLDGIRLWHQQYAHGKGAPLTTSSVLTKDNKIKAVDKSMKPPLSLRLGCDVSRQVAQAHGNAALTVKRMEEALERQTGIPVQARELDVDTMCEATSMGDLSWRPLLKEGAKKADWEAKRSFEIYGGRDAKEPPLGRVPKKAKLLVEDFVMGSELSVNGPYHKAYTASSFISF